MRERERWGEKEKRKQVKRTWQTVTVSGLLQAIVGAMAVIG